MKAIIILGLLILSSCASTYTCQYNKAGRCETVSAIYDKSKHESSLKQSPQTDQASEVKGPQSSVINPADKSPLLSKPKVLRLYMNHWEDEEGDLHVGGYMYIKVKDSSWEI